MHIVCGSKVHTQAYTYRSLRLLPCNSQFAFRPQIFPTNSGEPNITKYSFYNSIVKLIRGMELCNLYCENTEVPVQNSMYVQSFMLFEGFFDPKLHI